MNTVIPALTELQTLANPAFIINLIVKSTLILAFAGIINIVLSRVPAALRHGLWSAVFSVVLFLPLLSQFKPVFHLSLLPISTESVTEIEPASDIHPATSLELIKSGIGIQPEIMESGKHVEAFATSGFNWTLWIPGLWLIGAIFIVAKIAMEILSLNFIASRARFRTPLVIRATLNKLRDRLHIHRKIRIAYTGKISIPMTFGLFRPTVLLPAEAVSWSPKRMQTVLLHELAHIKRWDYFTNLVALTACAIYWFNPVVWIAVRQFYVERERASDDFVIRQGTENTDYAEQLLRIARPLAGLHNPGQHVLAIATGSQLKKRMKYILSPHTHRSSISKFSATAIVLGVVIMAAPLVFIDLNARPEFDNLPSLRQAEIADSPTQNLMQSLWSADPAIRVAAARELGKRKAENAVEPLLETLDDERSEVRIAVLIALGEIGEPDSFYRSAQMLKDKNIDVRVAALYALKGIGCDPAFVAVTYSLTAANSQVRKEAALILRQWKHKPMRTPVMKVLANYSQFFVTFLPNTLGEIQNMTAIEYLKNALNDPDPEVRREVAKTLTVIKET